MNFQNTKAQKGFTLIELIIVIIILGILAVTAAPKFLDIQDDARQSAISGIAGAVRSADQIARSGVLVGKTVDTDNDQVADSVTLEGINYAFSSGYIVAGEICRVVGLLSAAQTTAATPTSLDGAYVCNYTPANGAASAFVEIYPTGNVLSDGTGTANADAPANDCYVRFIDAAGTGQSVSSIVSLAQCTE